MIAITRSRQLVVTAGLAFALGACSSGEAAEGGPIVEGDPIGVQGAHEHGVVRMGLAVDGMTVTASVELPADAVFGFEHTPQTDEEWATVEAALARVQAEAGQLVAFDASLSCSAGPVEVLEAPSRDGHAEDDGHDHDEEAHEEDGHEHDDDHAHDEDDHEHAEGEHANDGDEGDGHAEGDHDHSEDATHSEVQLAMTWTCSASPEGMPAQLQAGIFGDIHDVDLTVVTSQGSAGARVEADAEFQM